MQLNGGLHSTEVAYLLLYPAAPGLNPSIPEIFSDEKIFDVAEVNQQRL